MAVSLAGKWVWIWNWRRCDGGDADRVAERLRSAGCAGAVVKAFDGPRWFDQGAAWREIAAALHERGVATGAWGYAYGDDPAGEAQRAVETINYGMADLLVLDVETEFKDRPGAAEELCRRVREGVGPDYPLYFSSFAIARYHSSFPFDVFRRHCAGAVPQVYWNAFRWPVAEALDETYQDHAALGIPPERIFPAGGLYAGGVVRHPFPEEVGDFFAGIAARGSRGASFWSYEHMTDEMWEAVRLGRTEEEDAMSSAEFQQLNESVTALARRVEAIEAEVRALGGHAPPTPEPGPRTYTVRPGDSLSAIAAHFGLGGWQRLYEANAGIIGPDPDLIHPGQVLVVP